MEFKINEINNGWLINGQIAKDPNERSTIYCKTIHVVADILTTWRILGHVKAQVRAKKLNDESRFTD